MLTSIDAINSNCGMYKLDDVSQLSLAENGDNYFTYIPPPLSTALVSLLDIFFTKLFSS